MHNHAERFTSLFPEPFVDSPEALRFDGRAACNRPLADWLISPGHPTLAWTDHLRDHS